MGLPANAAMEYYNQIPSQVQKYYQPYIEAGTSQLPGLEEQYKQLLGNPGERLNQIGEAFHESPGFKFALNQALQSMNNKEAMGGMAGSPENNQYNMELATNLGNQDYYNWLNHAQNLYGQGLQGSQGLAGMGEQAAQGLSDQVAQTLAQQGNLAFAQQNQRNQNKQDLFHNILGGLGALKAFFF